MNAFRPEVALTIKQMVDSWHTQSPKQLEEKIMVKDAAGCFDYGKPVINAYQPRANRDNRYRAGGWFPLRGGMDEQRRNRCFECGQTGHGKGIVQIKGRNTCLTLSRT